MPDDPIFVALQKGRPLTHEIVRAARSYRIAQSDALWEEVRILERLLEEQPDPRAVLVERDPPLETAERTYH